MSLDTLFASITCLALALVLWSVVADWTRTAPSSAREPAAQLAHAETVFTWALVTESAPTVRLASERVIAALAVTESTRAARLTACTARLTAYAARYVYALDALYLAAR